MVEDVVRCKRYCEKINWYFLRNEERSDECRGKCDLFAAMTPPVLVLAGMDLKVRRSATVVVGRSFGLFIGERLCIRFLIIYFRILCR